jgi:hypothetical protein
MIYLSIATEILIFNYFASFKLSTMVLSIAANCCRQITTIKPTLLHSKSGFKQTTYKFTDHEFQSNKFQRGGGEGEAPHRWQRRLSQWVEEARAMGAEAPALGIVGGGCRGLEEVATRDVDGRARTVVRRWQHQGAEGRWLGDDGGL